MMTEPVTSTAHRDTISTQAIQRLMTLTIIELEEQLIPSQGEGDHLYVYLGDVVVQHDMRRTLEVFDGDVAEAVENIRGFILNGILGDAADPAT